MPKERSAHDQDDGENHINGRFEEIAHRDERGGSQSSQDLLVFFLEDFGSFSCKGVKAAWELLFKEGLWLFAAS